MGCKTVHDAIGANLLRVVDQKRYSGSDPGLDQHVRQARPVLIEHAAHLVQHRWHRRQAGHPGEAFGVLSDQSLDGEGQFIGRHFRFGSNTPVMQNFRVLTRTGDQPDDGMGVAHVNGQQHGYRTINGERNISSSR